MGSVKILIFLGFVEFMVLFHSAIAGPAGKVVGQIGLVTGSVLVDSVKIKSGSPVRVGSVIEVQGDSKATLILGKGSVFQLGANSKMVVGEYGVSPEREELANLDLKFGKTRALILNQGPKRELKIRTRAATMGVRGTEIFVDSPQDSSKPVQFVTIEGLADVAFGPDSQAIPLAQNQSIRSPGKTLENGAPPDAPKEVPPNEIQATLREENLTSMPPSGTEAVPTLPPLPPGASRGLVGGLSDGFSIGTNAPITLDPLQDRIYRPIIIPQFCDANQPICP